MGSYHSDPQIHKEYIRAVQAEMGRADWTEENEEDTPLSSKAAKTDTTTAEDFEAVQDDMLALTLGAENCDDLIALLEGRGYIATTKDEETGTYQMAFVFQDAGDADAAPAENARVTSWRSIWERVGGDILKGRSLANWMLGKRTKLQSEIAEKEAFARARKVEIDEWCDREVNRREKSIGWFEDLLLAFHRRLGTKQESFPNGKVQWDKARVTTTWNMAMGLRVAIEAAKAEAWALADESAPFKDADAAKAFHEAQFIAVLSGYVDLKKTPVKDLLTKREDGGFQWTDGDGVVHEVIGVEETGEVPRLPSDGSGVQMAALEWCKANETYIQKIK